MTEVKLRAEDEEDLAVVSAIVQDALLPVADMSYLPEERRFALVVNRFCWECEAPRPGSDHQRILTGLCFSEVTAAKLRGFSRSEPDRILQILALRSEPGAVILDCAGGASLRLEVSRLVCHVEDMGEPWPTHWRPRHPDDEA